MTAVIIIALSTAIYAVIHSLLATLKVKARAHQIFGPATDRWYRLAYNIFAVISFLPILALLAYFPDRRLYAIPSPWMFLTMLGQLIGVLIIVLGIWQADAWFFIGIRQILPLSAQEKEPQLIVTGLYRWMRHPLYTGGLIVLWLIPVMTINTLTLTIMLSIYLIVGAKFEERRLLVEFGNAYAEYQQKVSMLIPKPPQSADN